MNLEALERELHTALRHLYDPDYSPGEALDWWALSLGYSGFEALQEMILRQIESLKPPPNVPTEVRSWRDYQVLHQRFVLGLSQLEVAERLAMSVRSVQRAQREAIHVLARRMWEQTVHESAAVTGTKSAPGEHAGSAGLAEWRSSLQHELAVLHRGSREARANLQEVIDGVWRVAQASFEGRSIALEAMSGALDIQVAIHPAVLRQILLGSIQELAQRMDQGLIQVRTERDQGRVWITLMATVTASHGPLNLGFARELLVAQGGSIETHSAGHRITLSLGLPTWRSPSEVTTVLVIDDNPDMATVLEAYCAGTRYRVVGLDAHRLALKEIKAVQPDVILLDVMLPRIDGWELLLRLRNDPQTGSVPVIICSVVADERLALSLGAACCLRKPVYPEQLMAALDGVLSGPAASAAAKHTTTPEAG